MKKLLITGDSFAADWTIKCNNMQGWPNKLANLYSVTNLAQAGCSEYKIYLQLASVDLNEFDNIIVAHTSPLRIYVKQHPIHKNNALHKNSDFLYADVKEHAKENKSVQCIVDYYENYFDVDYAVFVYNLICDKMNRLLSGYTGKIIHITNFPHQGLFEFNNMLDLTHVFKKYNGSINHYNSQGNDIVYKQIIKKLENTND
jgi:hypothetical protein